MSDIDLDLSLQKSYGHKLEHLYEINYVLEDDKILFTDLLVLNTYHAFTKPYNSIIKFIKSIIQPTHIPKQITRDEPIQLMLEYWITNYENLHKVTKLVQVVEPVYKKNKNGKAEIVFPKKYEE
ncbi:hypothetical protein CFOL_v3_01999 [Cephalotus follicularis]|uniref:Uncharacterized protein n=1 Tax=Cephalotus follicularis TaxID=3775 RepID=A0A1Q3AS15_CEPFO|nr:hypothetical protein CFOL_v3_01999 [Cephalotus follicularis]